MSYSDSVSSSAAGDYKNFRQIRRERLLRDMLRSANYESSTSKVLIMDKVTVKIMSSSFKMADLTSEGVSLVEDIYRRRQPLPSMNAIYFMQPTKENVIMFLSDMSGRTPLYKEAFVYFSSPLSRGLFAPIKESILVYRLDALKKMNKEGSISARRLGALTKMSMEECISGRCLGAMTNMNMEYFAIQSSI